MTTRAVQAGERESVKRQTAGRFCVLAMEVIR